MHESPSGPGRGNDLFVRTLQGLARLDAAQTKSEVLDTLAREVHCLTGHREVLILRAAAQGDARLVRRLLPEGSPSCPRQAAAAHAGVALACGEPSASFVLRDDAAPWGYLRCAEPSSPLLRESLQTLVESAAVRLRLIKALRYAEFRSRLDHLRDLLTRDLEGLRSLHELIQRHGALWLSLFAARGLALLHRDGSSLTLGDAPRRLNELQRRLDEAPMDTAALTTKELGASSAPRVAEEGLIAVRLRIGDMALGWLLLLRPATRPPHRRRDAMPELWPPTEKRAAIALGGDLAIAIAALEMLRLNRHLRKTNSRLEHLAHTDPLTRCWNRGHIERTIDERIEAAHHLGGHFALIMFDVDDFKRINDTHGHETGDRILKTLAEETQRRLRAEDRLGRWGGEEFVIVVSDATLEQAEALANRLCQAIAARRFEPVGRITVSVGVTQWSPSDRRRQLIKRADAAMYLAKRRGKNSVMSLI